MRTQKTKVKNYSIGVLRCFFIIAIVFCCSPKSYAQISNNSSKPSPQTASATSESAATSVTTGVSDTAATAFTTMESKTNEKDQSGELTAPNATVIGAKMALLGVLMGALVNFGSTAFVQHMQRENAREERKEAHEHELIEKKKEIYYHYLNSNKAIYTKLVNGEEIEDDTTLLINLKEATLWIEIYGSKIINEHVNRMNEFLSGETTDAMEYNNSYNKFLFLVKEELKIGSYVNTYPEESTIEEEELDDVEEI